MEFPKVVYVSIEGEAGHEYLEVNEDVAGHAEVGKVRTVGVYKLVETTVVRTTVTLGR